MQRPWERGPATVRLRTTPLFVAAFAALGLALLLPPKTGFARGSEVAVLGESPRQQVAIVSINLQECDETDVADRSDMTRFAARLKDKVPYAPDAVLLQEVKRTPARYVARQLSRRFDMQYVVASTGAPFRTERRGRVFVKDTAILLNTTTMTLADNGGYINTPYDKADAAAGTKLMVRGQAYVFAKEKTGGLELPLASVHYQTTSYLKSRSIADAYRESWSIKIAERLRSAYPSSGKDRIMSIGGDFNSGRAAWSANHEWQVMPFWSTLTNDYSLNDTLYTASKHISRRSDEQEFWSIDYIFSAGRVVDAASDLEYKTNNIDQDPQRFYSDHRFLWSVVGSKGLHYNQ